MSKTWRIECEPDGENDGVNECGMVVYLTNGSERKEVGAAGFIRRNAKNPDMTIDEAFAELIRTAKRALKLQAELDEVTADVERVMA